MRSDGRLRYANNSQYKADQLIGKEVYIAPMIIDEIKRIVKDSQILEQDDRKWPVDDKVGR